MQIRKSKEPKIQQNKTTLVQLPLATLGQETRWAYSTTLLNPHGARIVCGKRHKTFDCPSVRPSVPSIDSSSGGRRVFC